MKDKVAIFGDVHGESELLEKLIEAVMIETDGEAELYSMGDLIDRGPDSFQVIELCIKYNVKAVMGNHDLWFRNLVRDRMFDSFALEKVMGGDWTFFSYGVYSLENPNNAALELLQKVPYSHREFFKSIPDYRKIEVDGEVYWLIHAGLSNPVKNIFKVDGVDEKTDDQIMEEIASSGRSDHYIMWPSSPVGNKHIVHNMYKFEEGTQVLGHRPVKYPIINDVFIAVDTGCGTCDPFTLSAVLLPSRKVIQVTKD